MNQPLRAASVMAGLWIIASLPARAGVPQDLAREGQELYREGRLADALEKLEAAIAAGAGGGELLYQTGHCYKVARRDAVRSREHMARALPLLEEAAAAAQDDPAPLYYLSAIHAVELNDAEKGRAFAQRGVDQAEKGAFSGRKNGASLFQIGRLFALAGKPERAAGWYERAVAALQPVAGGPAAQRLYLTAALQELGDGAEQRGDHKSAAGWMQRLVELEPHRDQARLTAGQTMVKAGLYREAARTFRGFRGDDLMTEGNYLVRVLDRYVELGAPPLGGDAAKLDDAALTAQIDKAAARLAEIRKAEPPPSEPIPPEDDFWEVVTTKKGRKTKVPKSRALPEGWQPKDPNNPTPQEREMMSDNPPRYSKPVPPLPPSPERVAAEKEFFSLLVEMIRRGHLIREFSFTRGLHALIFR